MIAGHGGAIEYDLMTRAGFTLDDVPGRVPWRALAAFVGNLDASSAYVREVDPENARWLGTERIQSMLADLIDAVSVLDWHFCTANTEKGKQKPRKPRPYPRPWARDDGRQRIGSGAIPIRDFDEWWDGGGA